MKLKSLLKKEEEELIQELITRQAMEGCGYCKERDGKIQTFEEDMEKEKIRECQKSLEREKIARGMCATRDDELRLREMQKIQMQQKKLIEQEEEDMDRMWHEVLVDDTRRKETKEKLDEAKRQKEMLERRMAYDEQIASANRKKQDVLREEREKENRRLDRIKKKMEQDHYDAIKQKREIQMTNKINYIEGHQDKLSRLKEEKMQERELDNNTIRQALEELKKEKQRKLIEMRNLQMEKMVFTEYFNRERRIACQLEKEADQVSNEWKELNESKIEERCKTIEDIKIKNKEIAAQEYRRYLEERQKKLERENLKRKERMENVRQTAFAELQSRLGNANGELKKQIDYRNSLHEQIRDNLKSKETAANDLQRKEIPFTKQAEMFKDAMNIKYKMSSARSSTNPVHPFKMAIDTQNSRNAAAKVKLPSIGK